MQTLILSNDEHATSLNESDEMVHLEADTIEELLTQSAMELGLLDENGQELVNEEKSIVKLSKSAKEKALVKRSVLVVARQSNDSLFKEYEKLMKLRKKIVDKMNKKYESKARKMAMDIIKDRKKTSTHNFKGDVKI